MVRMSDNKFKFEFACLENVFGEQAGAKNVFAHIPRNNNVQLLNRK